MPWVEAMYVELDHVFVCAGQGGPEAAVLVDFGLTEGAPNRHPGQGTANRRFFFHNAFLELLWVEEPDEARNEPAARLHLWERWSHGGHGASPLGICVRPARPPGGNTAGKAPFATWPYRPAYLPHPLVIEMGANSDRIDEPLLFYLSFGHRPDADDFSRRQPLEHRASLRLITRLRVSGPPHDAASPELRALDLACPWLSIEPGGGPLMEIGFDGETAGKSHDFRPALPLVFHW
jgi:hypothetical protein